MTEVLPCPFCGVEPEVFPKHPEKEGNVWGEVRCVNPDCYAIPHVRDGINVLDDRGSEAYKNCAILRWNQRP